jgi:hypothetical protein
VNKAGISDSNVTYNQNVARVSVSQSMTGVIFTNGLLLGYGSIGSDKDTEWFFEDEIRVITRYASAVGVGQYHGCYRNLGSGITTCDIRVAAQYESLVTVPVRPPTWPYIQQVATGSRSWTCMRLSITYFPETSWRWVCRR